MSSSEFSLSYTNEGEREFGGGLSDPSSTQYQLRRNVFDIVNTLQSYGLQRQLDLPQIAVVGSQSVGKSSLIESISGGITLPRAKGTCTRCPIECRLSRVQADWSCHVSLRRNNDVQDIDFGPVIMDKSELEERIRRAQLAILNPSVPSSHFLESSLNYSDSNELSFSADVVSIRIAGRDVDDLSFVDLPGIIQSVRDGDNEADIEEVKSLVKHFIQRPSCLILLVVSCETDIENQGARQLARKVDPTGERTMPVLTKPDRIDVGQHGSWIQLVQNQQEKFKHGWHVVKQSNQQQLEAKIPWKEARRNETKFFNETEPWTTLDDSFRQRLGTEYLAQSLGNILFGMIRKRLPSILKEVESTLKSTRERLSQLPPKPEGDPIPAVYGLVDNFKRDISQLVAGRPEDEEHGLIQIFRTLSDLFGEYIFAQAPCFRPFDSAEDGPEEDTGEFHSNNDQDEGLEPPCPRNPNTFIYINEALKMAKNARTRELPKNTPFAVKKRYIQAYTAGWEHPAEELFQRVHEIFYKAIVELVHKHFSPFSHGGLQGTILRVVNTHLEKCSLSTSEKIKDCVELEQADPFSSNQRDLEHYKEKFMEMYTAARRESKKDTSVQDESTLNSLMQWLQNSNMDTYKAALARVLVPDKANEAIEIVAEVRAYYQVAYKRFIDYVPMIIDRNLLRQFDKELIFALTKGLALGEEGSSERCAALLQEDPDVEQERDSLRRTLQRFEGARAKLQSIPGIISIVDTELVRSEPDADPYAE